MANRYWVGGSGDWSDTAHWSTSAVDLVGQVCRSTLG